MALYTLKIYRRRKSAETIGWLDEHIELEADDSDAARHEASGKLSDVNWDTHFAGLEGDHGKFVIFWTRADA